MEKAERAGAGPGVPTQRLADLAISETGFVFDPRTGQSFTVNPTGLAAIQQLRLGKSPEAAAASLAEEYDAPAEIIAAGVRIFLKQLGRHLP